MDLHRSRQRHRVQLDGTYRQTGHEGWSVSTARRGPRGRPKLTNKQKSSGAICRRRWREEDEPKHRRFTLSPAPLALSFPIEQRDDLSQHSHAYPLTKATRCDGNCKTLTKCRVAKVHKCAGTDCNLDGRTTVCMRVLEGPNKIHYDSARCPSIHWPLANKYLDGHESGNFTTD